MVTLTPLSRVLQRRGDRHYAHFTKEEAEARDLTPYKIQSSQRSAVCLFPLDKGLPRPGPQTWEGPQRSGDFPGQRRIHPLSLRGSLGRLDLGEGVPQVSPSPGDQECWVGGQGSPGVQACGALSLGWVLRSPQNELRGLIAAADGGSPWPGAAAPRPPLFVNNGLLRGRAQARLGQERGLGVHSACPA